MNERDISAAPVSAPELRDQLELLNTERTLALHAGLGEVRSYMADLDEELEQWRRLYSIAAVTEIATLRGELFGMQFG
jgi:hypothetical protein